MDENDSHPTVPDDEKRLIRAVLFSEWGIPFDKFQKFYHEVEGRPFPFKKLGFSSLKECLESIPDVVRFEYSQEASKWILYAIADDKSFMSSFTRKKQLTNTKAGLPQKSRRRGRSSSSGRNGHQTKETTVGGTTDEDGSGLVLSQRGLYSIIVRAGELCLDKEEFTELFKDTAPIAEVSSFQRQRGVFLFFRYKKKEDALAVIKKFNNYEYEGRKLIVKPAEEQNPLKGPLPTPAISNTTQARGVDTSKTVQICFDFKSGKCHRQKCKFLHVEEGNEIINTSPSSPRSSEGGSSSTSGSILPPPLLEDDDEDDWDESEEEEGVDGSSFQESGPPPLESDSDSGGWSDEDESKNVVAVTNGYHTVNSHNGLGVIKKFSPGRGRGLSQFR